MKIVKKNLNGRLKFFLRRFIKSTMYVTQYFKTMPVVKASDVADKLKIRRDNQNSTSKFDQILLAIDLGAHQRDVAAASK